MNRLRLALAVTAALLCSGPSPAQDDPVAKAVAALYEGIRAETLPNGLRVYLKPIPEAPTVTVMTAYRVGSADEEPGQTGLAHYLEHLMFKGTDRLLPGDIDRQTRRAGGQNNAYTTYDFTNYHFDFASGRWETALQIEADRMRHLRIDEKHEFQQEKGAVIAELEGNEDQPYDLETKAILPLLFGPKSPYGHPIIGQKADVRAATAEVIKGFYDRWYHPNNAVLVIAGGFDPDRAAARVRELFGPIPAGKLPERKAAAVAPRDKPVRVEIPSKFEAERLVMGFNTCKVGEPDDYVLDVIEYLLSSGKTGRLYRRLVLDQEVAAEVVCANQAGRLPGWFSVEMEIVKGVDRRKAEEALLAELEELAREPVSAAELKRVVRNVVAGMIFEREDVHALADGIINAVAMADLDYLKGYLPKVQAVTPADVQRVAKKYLDPQQRVVVASVLQGKGGKKKAPARPQEGEPSRVSGRVVERRTAGRKGTGCGPSGRHPAAHVARFALHRSAREPATGATVAADAADLTKTRRIVLDNGLTLLLLERRRLPIVFAEAHVARVRLHEPADQNGVAALVGMLLEEGTEKRSEEEIAHAIEDVGGVLQTAAGGGHVKVLAPDRKLGLDLLLDCLARPAFKLESVRRLKEHLQAEIEDQRKQPEPRAKEEFLKAVYGDHPLGRPGLGTPDAVEGLNAAACREFHRRVFRPNNTVLVVVGDFDSNTVVEEVKALTKDWTKRDLPPLTLPPPRPLDKFAEKIVPLPDASQLSLYLGHLGITRKDPDYYKLLVMDNILGVGTGFTDRLSAKLRDREGLAYTVSATITATAGEQPGVFSAYVGTYPDKFPRVKSILFEEINRIRAEKPTAREVEEAKDYLLGTLAFRLETSADLAGQLLLIERHGLGLDYLEKFRRAVGAVTPEGVHEAAHKYLHPERMVLAAAGPVDERGKPLPKDD